MKTLDFKGYTFITTTYAGRLPMVVSTLAGVMTQVTNAEFVIQWCDTEEHMPYLRHVLGMIASNTGNSVRFYYAGLDMPVAYTKTNFKPSEAATHFVNLDDDLLVTEESLRILHSLRQIPVVTIGVQDAYNARGFADYDDTRYESLSDFLKVHPFGKAKHHRFALISVIPNYKWISQLYCMRREVYENPETWAEVKRIFTQKGIRGYDIVLENVLAASGVPISLIVGCEALHIGLEHAYIGGPWTGANQITKTVVELNDGNKQ